jgi:hypothetical protein
MRIETTDKTKRAVREALQEYGKSFLEQNELNDAVDSILSTLRTGNPDTLNLDIHINLNAGFIEFTRALIKAYEKYPEGL